MGQLPPARWQGFYDFEVWEFLNFARVRWNNKASSFLREQREDGTRFYRPTKLRHSVFAKNSQAAPATSLGAGDGPAAAAAACLRARSHVAVDPIKVVLPRTRTTTFSLSQPVCILQMPTFLANEMPNSFDTNSGRFLSRRTSSKDAHPSFPWMLMNPVNMAVEDCW